jgi:hypothetical protein
MTVQDELVHAAAAAVPADALDPSALCRGCSLDELHTIANRGAHGGDLYFAAAAELERRAKESDAAAHAEQERVEETRQHLVWLVAASFALATMIALWLAGLI